MGHAWIPWADVPIGATFHVRGHMFGDYVRLTDTLCIYALRYRGWVRETKTALKRFPTRADFDAWNAQWDAKKDDHARIDAILAEPGMTFTIMLWLDFRDYPLDLGPYRRHPRPCYIVPKRRKKRNA